MVESKGVIKWKIENVEEGQGRVGERKKVGGQDLILDEQLCTEKYPMIGSNRNIRQRGN